MIYNTNDVWFATFLHADAVPLILRLTFALTRSTSGQLLYEVVLAQTSCALWAAGDVRVPRISLLSPQRAEICLIHTINSSRDRDARVPRRHKSRTSDGAAMMATTALLVARFNINLMTILMVRLQIEVCLMYLYKKIRYNNISRLSM